MFALQRDGLSSSRPSPSAFNRQQHLFLTDGPSTAQSGVRDVIFSSFNPSAEETVFFPRLVGG
jgi:hypothetical protein